MYKKRAGADASLTINWYFIHHGEQHSAQPLRNITGRYFDPCTKDINKNEKNNNNIWPTKSQSEHIKRENLLKFPETLAQTEAEFGGLFNLVWRGWDIFSDPRNLWPGFAPLHEECIILRRAWLARMRGCLHCCLQRVCCLDREKKDLPGLCSYAAIPACLLAWLDWRVIADYRNLNILMYYPEPVRTSRDTGLHWLSESS